MFDKITKNQINSCARVKSHVLLGNWAQNQYSWIIIFENFTSNQSIEIMSISNLIEREVDTQLTKNLVTQRISIIDKHNNRQIHIIITMQKLLGNYTTVIGYRTIITLFCYDRLYQFSWGLWQQYRKYDKYVYKPAWWL